MDWSRIEGIKLAYLAICIGIVWSVHARADEVVIAAPAQEHLARLPAFQAGGIRSGQVMTITASSTASANSAMLALGQVSKRSANGDLCIAH